MTHRCIHLEQAGKLGRCTRPGMRTTGLTVSPGTCVVCQARGMVDPPLAPPILNKATPQPPRKLDPIGTIPDDYDPRDYATGGCGCDPIQP